MSENDTCIEYQHTPEWGRRYWREETPLGCRFSGSWSGLSSKGTVRCHHIIEDAFIACWACREGKRVWMSSTRAGHWASDHDTRSCTLVQTRNAPRPECTNNSDLAPHRTACHTAKRPPCPLSLAARPGVWAPRRAPRQISVGQHATGYARQSESRSAAW